MSETVPDNATSPGQLPERAWWMAMRYIPHIGNARLQLLYQHFGSIATAWQASLFDLREVLPQAIASGFISSRAAVNVEQRYDDLLKSGANAVCLIDADYPELLREIPGPPPLLFYKGQLTPADSASVAIVGTRRMTAYGREMANRISYDLAAAGITIVSGLARGVDGVAHRAALEAGGRTIAVLGSGIDVIYPGNHRDLAGRIGEQGAIVTEFLPGTPPDRFNFPPRNRIISGFSRGVVVIEAPERSGALITVDFAAEQGRDAFAVPGSVNAPTSAGCLRILRDGATLVRSADDILEDLHLQPLALPTESGSPRDAHFSDSERRLLAVLTGEPQHIDDIAEKIGASVSDTSAQLMMLELAGNVRDIGSGYYSRK